MRLSETYTLTVHIRSRRPDENVCVRPWHKNSEETDVQLLMPSAENNIISSLFKKNEYINATLFMDTLRNL